MLRFDSSQFEPLHLSAIQQRFALADTQNVHAEMSRASGKSTKILGPRLVRVANDMPGSHISLVASTYRAIFDNILPVLLDYLNTYYKQGIHFEVGKIPPKHFKRPYSPVFDWKHTISLWNGAVVPFISCDRPESSLGKNNAHIIADEFLRIPEDDFTGRIVQTLRANKNLFGHSPYFRGLSTCSSSPDFETDEDWWLKLEENMDKTAINEIMYVALRVDHAKFELKMAKSELTRQKAEKFINYWGDWLRRHRKGQTLYLKASAFSNIIALSPEYIEEQFKLNKNYELFKLTILNLRPKRVKDMFFAHFSKKHIYNDSYIYGNIDNIRAGEKLDKYSRDLKYCESTKPLVGGFDPGSFMSLIIAQHHKGEFRAIKEFWKISPDQHAEMAQSFADFFQYHKNKELFLHYDRAGNKLLDDEGHPDAQSDLDDTDAKILQRELQARGWKVHLMSIGQRMIWHWEHYSLLNILFGQRDRTIDKIIICANECEALISSINMSPLKKTDGKIRLDKSSEKKLPFEQQAFWSTQLATALMYMLWGEYNKILPKHKQDIADYDTVIL
jgi:hypothetical protein